jgi:hypothetical protein
VERERGKAREERREKEGKGKLARLVGRWFVALGRMQSSRFVSGLATARLDSSLPLVVADPNYYYFRRRDYCTVTVRGNTACPPLAQYHTKTRMDSVHLRSL